MLKKFNPLLVLFLLFFSYATFANDVAEEFTEDVLLHIVLHEMGHALVREFDLPILGNEETMADAFATHYLIHHLPDRALDVLTARVNSLLIESQGFPRNQWSVSGEHNNDARRAHQIAALAIAANYEKYANLPGILDMSDSDIRRARDYGTEIHRSWRRILQPLLMPANSVSNEARVGYDEENELVTKMNKGPLLINVKKALTSFDWHSQVTVRFVSGDGGASWSRNGRTIAVYSSYIQRFIEQANQKKGMP